ncbi:MAG: hypothetical protein FJZ61_00485 [Chlamydiae bacterium]|nr:hypothetical protein [Chlamydiota bacterium]
MNPLFVQQPQSYEPATDLVGAKTGRRSQSHGKENDSEILVDSAQPHPNKRQCLFHKTIACPTIHLTAETSTSSFVCAQLCPTGILQPQSCIQGALLPRFFEHISPEQASSPSFFLKEHDGELSELSENEEDGDPMDGAACVAFNPQKPGTPIGRAQDGFVTPDNSDNELSRLLGGGSPEFNIHRSPSGLAKILNRLASINLGPNRE